MKDAGPGSSDVVSRKTLRPIRRRGRKILATLLVIYISVPLALLLYSEARFHLDVNARHDRGQPVLPQDFAVAPIADQDNAATYLHLAAKLLEPTICQDFWLEEVRGRTLAPVLVQYASEVISKRADAFSLLRKARQCAGVDWHLSLVSPVMEHALLGHVKEQRALARVLYLLALYQHDAGDDEAAVDTLRDMLFIAHAVDQQPTGISHLVAGDIECLACDALVRVAPSLRIQDVRQNSRRLDGQAARTGVDAIVGELLDDAPRQSALLRAWDFERMTIADSLRTDSHFSWVVRRWGTWESIEVMREYDVAASASRLPNWRAAQTILNAAPEPASMMAQMFHGSFSRPIELHLKRATERHVAATALAMRLYQVDHAGAWPAKLNDLVPRYLPSVPLDPFSPDNRPLGYVPGNPPAIYSVGVDEIDGHADRTDAIDDYGIYKPWLALDAVFPMGGVLISEDWDPQHPPSSMPPSLPSSTPRRRER
ncbi:MAG TPA: hypothetical protein VH370_10925 [Humisphaera sp.]|jgi:hypothetical protein|nr:hypothetical protein [Humisphaera sp.]